MPTDRPPPPGRGLLTGPRAGELLAAAVTAAGDRLGGWSVRSVHARADSLAVVYRAELEATDRRGARSVLLVAHTSTRSVPQGAAQVEVGDYVVHLWQFPHDPYLPGLPPAVRPATVRELLDGLGVEPGPVRLHTRSYRPTRRAVVEVSVTPPGRQLRALYLKVLGGRRAARATQRAQELAATHRALTAAGLPVPKVVGVAPGQAIVALTAVAGATLRSLVVDPDASLPEPGSLAALSQRLASLPTDTGAGRPRGFAAVGRHVPTLVSLVPDLRVELDRLATEADAIEGPEVTVHGDLHDGQLLFVDAELSGLLDVDGVGPGLVAQDAGRLVAHLEVTASTHPQLADRALAYSAAVAAAYAPMVGWDALARAAAGAWLGLATGPYRAQDDGWEDRTRQWIGHGLRWLDVRRPR